MKQKPRDSLPGALALAAKNVKTLIILNLMCLLHALLIVTAGRSLAALTRCCMRLTAGETFDACTAFREEFQRKDSTKACWIFLLALALAGLAIWLCYRSVLRLLLLVALLAAFGSGVIVYYLPMAVMIDIPPLVALQNAFALSLVLAKRTIPSACFVVVWGALCAMYPPYTPVLFLLAGLSLPILVCAAIGWPGVKELVVEKEDAIPSSDQYYIEPKKVSQEEGK